MPDHLPAAGQHHAPHAGQPRCLQDVVDADHVVRQQLRQEVIVVGRGGQVDDRCHALRGPSHGGAVGDAGRDGFVRSGRRAEVEAADEMAARLQLADHGLTDPARRAGDEDVEGWGHVRGFRPRWIASSVRLGK